MSLVGTRPPTVDIYVYRRKRIDEYINEVERIIKRLL